MLKNGPAPEAGTASMRARAQSRFIFDTHKIINYHSCNRFEDRLARMPSQTARVCTRLLIPLFLSYGSSSASNPRPYLAIVEKVAGAVAFYSEDGRQVGKVAVGPFPHEAALSRD